MRQGDGLCELTTGAAWRSFAAPAFSQQTRLLSRRLAAFCLLVVTSSVLGCGDTNPFRMEKVTGRVVYEDGSVIPVDSIAIRFDSLTPPLDAKTHPRPGFAFTNPDGTFQQVTSHKANDGIVRGKHRVSLAVADGEQAPIPEVYRSPQTTPVEIDSANSPLEIRIARP